MHSIGIQPRLSAPPLPHLIVHAVLLFQLPLIHHNLAIVRFIKTLLDFIDGRQHRGTVCIHLRYCKHSN
jgi:hypothetical protein